MYDCFRKRIFVLKKNKNKKNAHYEGACDLREMVLEYIIRSFSTIVTKDLRNVALNCYNAHLKTSSTIVAIAKWNMLMSTEYILRYTI